MSLSAAALLTAGCRQILVDSVNVATADQIAAFVAQAIERMLPPSAEEAETAPLHDYHH